MISTASVEWLLSFNGSWGGMGGVGGCPYLRKSPEDQQKVSPSSYENSLERGQGFISTQQIITISG